ncbi:uncharacterized protein LOC125490571 [Plutella xylostella]|uniref:uncharacterized protein LOC125490571 n=1 Tax=Plutella xylostella TaxID=51655 RepID=UPI0020321E9D|nr:uncharacterized protein LOC125490571 [Plutella xylostella]
MFLNIVAGGSPSPGTSQQSAIKSIYQSIHNIWGAPGSSVASSISSMESQLVEETFVTPVSSTGDLLALSPGAGADLLTGEPELCDVTMHDAAADDMFIDATSLDYLVRCAESNRNLTMIDRGKESLYVKFDPLYSRQKQASQHLQSLSMSHANECDVGYETGSAASVYTDNMIGTPKRSMSTDSMMFSFSKDNKPTQRVRPAIKKEVPEGGVNITHSTPALVRSVSAILTPSRVAIDRLISITGNTPPINMQHAHSEQFNTHQLDHLQSLRNILQKQDQEVMQLRQENRELRTSLQDTEHKLHRTEEDMQDKIKKMTEEKEKLLEREIRLEQQINEKNVCNKQMSIVMEEYEKTISSLIGEQQKENLQAKEAQEQLQAERDDALRHLTNMEASFNDLLSKYEKCKSVILETKDRETSLLRKITEYEEGMKKYDDLYSKLKEVTSESLAKANETLDNIKKTHCYEMAKLNATIKKNELNMSSLQESLQQKTRENAELTKICDQLIASVR